MAPQNQPAKPKVAPPQPRTLTPDDRDWVPRPVIQRNVSSPLEQRGFQGALYDSRLTLHGRENAELTLTLKILFQRLDPTPRGGGQKLLQDGWGNVFMLTEIDDASLFKFREQACRQANGVWRGVGLVTPNDFTGLDFPRHNTYRPFVVPGQAFTPNLAIADIDHVDDGRSVRPNVDCNLKCEWTESLGQAHAIVKLIAVSAESTKRPKEFGSSVLMRKKGRPGTRYEATWEMTYTGSHITHADQDPAFFWFAKEDIEQYMVPHEVGHLLGLDHIGEIMNVHKCRTSADTCSMDELAAVVYGHHKSLPMWMARNIMGSGNVVHACNLLPWAHAMEQHTGVAAERWIPAGTRIPPRQLKDIPKKPYTLADSPYLGGFQERDKY
jgi:hypothetical protein